jgi:hypothetical protein
MIRESLNTTSQNEKAKPNRIGKGINLHQMAGSYTYKGDSLGIRGQLLLRFFSSKTQVSSRVSEKSFIFENRIIFEVGAKNDSIG